MELSLGPDPECSPCRHRGRLEGLRQGQESGGFPCFWKSLLCRAEPSLLLQPGCVHPPTCQPWHGRGQGQRLTVVCWLIMYSECLQQHIPDQWCLSWRQAPAVEEGAPARGCQESWLLRPRPGSRREEWGLSSCRELFGPWERWTNRTSQEIDNYWLGGSELAKNLRQ